MEKTIYALIDPRTGDVRYVGASVDVKRRVKDHLVRWRGESHCARWLAQLRDEGLRPCVWELAVVGDEWEEVEAFWINTFRGLFNLTNIMNGGQGASAGVPKSEATRQKMSAAATGRVLDAATRAKISAKTRARQLGTKRSSETKAKIAARQLGVPKSAETRAKMAVAQQARQARARFATATMEA